MKFYLGRRNEGEIIAKAKEMNTSKLIKGDYVHNAGLVIDFINKLYAKGYKTEEIDKELKNTFNITLKEFNPLFWCYYFCRGEEDK